MRFISALFLLFFMSNFVQASIITYDANNVSGNQWTYEYSIFNDTLINDIEWFAIYFDYNLYDNLQIISTPSDWDPLLQQPDTGLPDDGVYDVLAFSSGIAPGSSLAGFIVQFDYFGSGTPGSQAFEIYDPLSASIVVIDSGDTSSSQNAAEPNIFLLLVMGMTLAGLRRLQAVRKI